MGSHVGLPQNSKDEIQEPLKKQADFQDRSFHEPKLLGQIQVSTQEIKFDFFKKIFIEVLNRKKNH